MNPRQAVTIQSQIKLCAAASVPVPATVGTGSHTTEVSNMTDLQHALSSSDPSFSSWPSLEALQQQTAVEEAND